MKLRYYTIPLALILACAALALTVRLSYTDEVSTEFYEYTMSGNTSFTRDQGLEGIPPLPTVEEQLAQSDLIARVTFGGQRKVTADGFYTDVLVEEVYQGDQQLKGQTLCILEQVSVFKNTKYLNMNGKLYLPLQEGNEYLLLLKKMPFVEYRKLNAFQNRQYYPTSETALSVFRMSGDRQLQPLPGGQTPILKSMNGQDLPTSVQEDLTLYYETKDRIFQKFGLTET